MTLVAAAVTPRRQAKPATAAAAHGPAGRGDPWNCGPMTSSGSAGGRQVFHTQATAPGAAWRPVPASGFGGFSGGLGGLPLAGPGLAGLVPLADSRRAPPSGAASPGLPVCLSGWVEKAGPS